MQSKKRKNGPKAPKRATKRKRGGDFDFETKRFADEYGFEAGPLYRVSPKAAPQNSKAAKKCTVRVRWSEKTAIVRFGDGVVNSTVVRATVDYWTSKEGGRKFKKTLCKAPWNSPVNAVRAKVLRAFEAAGVPPDRIMKFIVSQREGKVCKTVRRKPYCAIAQGFLRTLFGTPESNVVLRKIVERLKAPRDPRDDVEDAGAHREGSTALWLAGTPPKEAPEKLLCQLPMLEKYSGLRDQVMNRLRTKEARARFAASQLVGAPVTRWLEILPDMDPSMVFPTFMDDRRRNKLFFVDDFSFKLLQSLLTTESQRNSWCPSKPPAAALDNVVGICDLKAPSLSQAMVYRGNDVQVEFLFLEHMASLAFFQKVLNALQKEDHIGAILLGKMVSVKLEMGDDCVVVLKRLTVVESKVPREFENALMNAKGVDVRLAAHRVLKFFYGKDKSPEGSLGAMVELYKDKYSVFCIADACAETAHGKMMVYQSPDFMERFNLEEKVPLLKIDSSVEFWRKMIFAVLQGKSPSLPIDMRHRDGSYQTYSANAYRCARKRFLVITLEAEMKLPDHLEEEKHLVLNKEDNKMLKVDFGFRALKHYLFLPSSFSFHRNGHVSLDQLVSETEKRCATFAVVDMHEPSLATAIKYASPAFMGRLKSLEYLVNNVHRPPGYTHRSFLIWDILVCPLYNGKPVLIKRKFTCADGKERWYAIKVSFSPKKRFVVGAFEEIDPPNTNRTAEMVFGCHDFRPHAHFIVRGIEGRPTLNRVNEDELERVKAWMQQEVGKEREGRTFSVIDKCFDDVFKGALVYRSPHGARRYGDWNKLLDRIESSYYISLHSILNTYTSAAKTLWGMVKGMITGAPVRVENTIKVLTVDRAEVDTIDAVTLFPTMFDGRYVVVCWNRRESVPYLGM